MSVLSDIEDIEKLGEEIIRDEKEIEAYRSDKFWDTWMKPKKEIKK